MAGADRPEYLERFPELAMAEISRLPLRNRYVIWRTNEQQEIGSAEVKWSEYSIRLQYIVRGDWMMRPDRGIRELSLRPVARGTHSFRYHVICRACGEYVYRLFFRTQDWLCQSCQGLRHRSTYLSPQLRWQEEYDVLRYTFADGRPPGMRSLEYSKKRDRMLLLRDKLDGTRRRPGPEFNYMIYAEWQNEDPET